MKSLARIFVAAASFSVRPVVANACSSCMVANPKTVGTYLAMTLMLTALPLGIIASLIYWLRKRYSQSKSSETAEVLVGRTSSPAEPL